jgi:hypothetical protein
MEATAIQSGTLPTHNNVETTTYPVSEMQEYSTYPADFFDFQTIIAFEDLTSPTEVKTPKEGFASISGLLYEPNGSRVLKNLDFYLVNAVVVGEKKVIPPIITNADPNNGDILGRTDNNGIFFLDNVPPGDYYLIINFPDHTAAAQSNQTSDSYLLISVVSGDQMPLGILLVSN